MRKEPTFDWDTEGKYNELKNFRLDVYKGLQLLEMLTQVKKKNV